MSKRKTKSEDMLLRVLRVAEILATVEKVNANESPCDVLDNQRDKKTQDTRFEVR